MKLVRALSLRLLLAALMAIALLFCVRQMQTEYHVLHSLDMLQSSDAVIDRSREGKLSARESLYRGMALARSAAQLPSGDGRDAVLDDAARLIAAARAERARWGEAMVAEAYLNLLRYGQADLRTLSAFRASYRVAPFLREQADWRIQYAIAVWPLIEPDDRQSVAREAILLARGSRNLAAHVRVLASGTDLQPMIANRIWQK